MRVTEKDNGLALTANDFADAQFINDVRLLESTEVCLAFFTAFLQTDGKIIPEHGVFEHRCGLINHNQRGNPGFAGFRLDTMHDITDDGRRQDFVFKDVREVKSHKTFRLQIQAVVSRIKNIAVLVGIDPFEKLPTHISGRRKTAFIQISHHPFFGTKVVKRRCYGTGNFLFGNSVVHQSNGANPPTQESAVVRRIGTIKRIKGNVFLVTFKADICSADGAGENLGTAVAVEEKYLQITVAHSLTGKKSQQSRFTLTGGTDDTTVSHRRIFTGNMKLKTISRSRSRTEDGNGSRTPV